MGLSEPTTSLDPRVRTLWTVEAVLTAVVSAVVGAGVLVGLEAADVAGVVPLSVAVASVVVGLVVLAVVGPRLRWRHHRYDVLDDGLHVTEGWVVRRHHLLPHARVQTVDTRSGPLARALGLVEVEIRTASHAGSLVLPGLAPEVAAELVAVLAARAGHDQAA